MLITVPYNHKKYFSNRYASKPRNLADELTFNWEGKIQLSPSFDNWVDTEVLPERNVDFGPSGAFWEELGDQIGFNIEEGSWNTVARSGDMSTEVLWDVTEIGGRGGGGSREAQAQLRELAAQGVPRLGGVNGSDHSSQFTRDGVTFDNPSAGVTHQREIWGISEEITQERMVEEDAMQTETQRNSLGERVVDVGLEPFMRQRSITVTGYDLKANTRFWVYFDGVDVTDNCSPTEIVSNDNGEVNFIFTIPRETFNVGQRTLEIVDDPENRKNFITSTAKAEYTANGLSVQKESTVISTEVPQIVTEQRVERRTTDEMIGAVMRDPTAYTFLVDQEKGAFLTGLDLYFRLKSDTDGVIVQIRNTINGYPGPVVVPFSEVRLSPSDVNISENATVKTEVRFDNPIHLNDGEEYAICLLPEQASTDYELWVSELGGRDITSGGRIVELPGAGIVFSSANNSAWSPHQQEDFKCDIYFGDFQTNSNSTITFTNADIDRLELTNFTNGLPVFGEYLRGNQFLTLNSSAGSITVGATVEIDTVPTEVLSVDGSVIGVSHDVIVSTGSTVTYDTSSWTVNSIEQAQGKVDNSNSNETILIESNGLFTIGMECVGSVSETICEISDILNYSINVFQPRVSEILLSDTTVDWIGRFYNAGQMVEKTIKDNRDYRTEQEYHVLSKSNEVQSNSSNKSLELVATLNTAHSNITPIVDADKISSIVVNYNVNFEDDSDELTTNNGANECRYFTKRIDLSLPAEDLLLFFEGKIPEGATVLVYYKVQHEDDPRNFDDIDWKYINGAIANGDFFREYFFTPEETDRDANSAIQYTQNGNTYTGFSKYAIKIVMQASNTSKIPYVNSLRAIALMV